jgi:aldose 1-epimerase
MARDPVSSAGMHPITLRRGPLGVALLPAVGGSLARFWLERAGAVVDLLRPAPDRAPGRHDPWAMACFPLVPWSNRIRHGRFRFGGRDVALAPNLRGHAIHGHGFQRAWAVSDLAPTEVTLEYRHSPDAWPWAYRAVQRIALEPTGLELELRLTSEDGAAMPAGLGWHPYFPRTPETTLAARVTGLWVTDAEILPLECVVPPPERDPGRGLAVDRTALDNAFVGWDGRAVVTWPEREARLHLVADPLLGTLVVYTPPGASFFCAEPVSHVTDAFNLAGAGRTDTGMRALDPGETVRARLTLTPELA